MRLLSVLIFSVWLTACGGDFSGAPEPSAPLPGGPVLPGLPTASPAPPPGTGGEPPGATAEARLANGEREYQAQCQSCHGIQGRGGVGGRLDSAQACPSCATLEGLAQRIHDTMPSSRPASCVGACAEDVALYIRNGFSRSPAAGPTPTGSPGGGATPAPSAPPTTPPDPDCEPPPPPPPATATPPPGASPSPTPPAGTPSPTPAPESACAIEFRYASSWNVGFVAEVVMRNGTAAPVTGWEARWTFPDDQRVTNAWNTDIAQNGAAIVATPKDYNRTIPAGGTVSFGMQGTHGGVNRLPTDVRFEAPGCGVVTAKVQAAKRQTCEPTPTPTPPPVACDLEAPAAPRLLRLLTRREYQRTVEALTGLTGEFALNLPTEARVKGYDNNARVALVTSRHVDRYLDAAAQIAERAITERRSALVPCDPSGGNRTHCARQFAERFGARAFRRPLTQAERDQYAALMDDALTGGNTDAGFKLIIQAMLASPHFLYRSELGQPEGNRFRLDGHEIASALSYLLTGLPPDEALTADAAAGRLATADGREAAARRLLATSAAREQMAYFASLWLGTDALQGAFKDPDIFPRFNDAVREGMTEELARFINHVVFDSGDGSLRELLTADYVFVNDALRAFYRLPGSGGWAQQPVTNGERGGLLTLGAVLAAQAHSNESSPIKRGVFVRERLLCHPLPEPPPDVDTTPPGLDPRLTTRERFRRHTDDPACASCHAFIDGLGFGFERYDGVGDFRTVEHGLPVDDSGELRGPEGFDDGRTLSFNGPRQLAALLAETRSVNACVAMQVYRYARGYIEGTRDDCALRALTEAFIAGGGRLQDLLIELVRQPSFVLRHAE